MRRVTCHNVEALLFDYADGAVDEPERAAIAVHLAICDGCRESAELVSGVRIAVRDAPLPPAPLKRKSVSIEVDRFAGAKRWLRSGAFATTAAAACAAAALGLWLASAADDVTSAPILGSRAAAVPGAPSGEGAPDPAPTIDRAGHVAFELAPGTALRCDDMAAAEVVSSVARGARFALSAGLAVAEVGAVEPGFRFVVATPTVEVEARGTVFSVEVQDRSATAVRVAAGSVEVRDLVDGAAVVVSAGEELRAGDLEPHTAAVDDVTRDLAVALELGSAEGSSLVAAGDPDQSSFADAVPARTPAEVVSISEALVAAIASARDHLSAVSGGSRPAHLLALAQAYRRASLFEDAASTYARLVDEHPDSEIGLDGLVALAQLESLVLGRSDAARSHYAAYLKAAPRGPLAPVARDGLEKTNAD